MKIWKLKIESTNQIDLKRSDQFTKYQCITYTTMLSGPVASFPLPNLNAQNPTVPFESGKSFTNSDLKLREPYGSYGFRIST